MGLRCHQSQVPWHLNGGKTQRSFPGKLCQMSSTCDTKALENGDAKRKRGWQQMEQKFKANLLVGKLKLHEAKKQVVYAS